MNHHQRIFRQYQHCPQCDHRATTVYTPDLLTGPVESECMRYGCELKWSLAIETNGPQSKKIREHIRLAERLALLLEEIKFIRRILDNDA